MKTTFSRTFSATLIILLTALILVGTTFQALVENYLKESALEELDLNGTAIANLAGAYYSEGSIINQYFMVNLDIAAQVSGSDLVVCDATGRIILCSDVLSGCDHQDLWVDRAYMAKVASNNGDTATGLIQGLYTEARYVVSKPITDPVTGQNMGIVIASRPTVSTTTVMMKINSIFIMVSFLVVLVCIIAMGFIVSRQSDPLKQMARVARAFGHGDLDARVRLQDDYPEEVEDLALAFNNMATELQKSEYQRREFVANVSHELKTRMTTIAGYVDGILDNTIPQHRHRYYLQIVSDETKRLSRLVRSMLDISRLQDGGIPEEKKVHFDMEEALGQVLITFEKKITDKNLNVDVEMPEHPVYTRADQDSIIQVIYNLLDNAVKFCQVGGRLGVEIRQTPEKIYVAISNTGNPIPVEELPFVFERFHKTDKSRTDKDGWGLGLYIVKTIVCSHGENIRVSSAGDTTEFTFTLPCA